jgi:hypothetical protein
MKIKLIEHVDVYTGLVSPYHSLKRLEINLN